MGTRWGSTYIMLKRYLKIDKVLREAHEELVIDRVKYNDKGPSDPLKPKEKAIVEVLVNVRGIGNSTAL